jgi:hypothetical protein
MRYILPSITPHVSDYSKVTDKAHVTYIYCLAFQMQRPTQLLSMINHVFSYVSMIKLRIIVVRLLSCRYFLKTVQLTSVVLVNDNDNLIKPNTCLPIQLN